MWDGRYEFPQLGRSLARTEGFSEELSKTILNPSEAQATDTSRNIVPGPCIVGHKAAEGQLPYIYIDKVFHELRSELLSAMHSALEAQGRKGQVDVDRLYRAFTRAAAGKCANPQRVSEKCVAETMTSKPRKAKDARIDE